MIANAPQYINRRSPLTPQVESILAGALEKESGCVDEDLRDELDEMMPEPAWGEAR